MGEEALATMADQAAAIPEEIAEVRRRLEEWRGAHWKREPFPEELWGTAVSLAQQHNVHRVARALGLDYGTLKRRMPVTTKEPAAAFLELILADIHFHPPPFHLASFNNSRKRRCTGSASTSFIERFALWVRSFLPRPVVRPSTSQLAAR